MKRPSRKVLLLIVLGSICLPAPIYLNWAATAVAPPPKTSQIYLAESIQPVDKSDRDHVIDRHTNEIALDIQAVSERHSPGVYRAPVETRRVLETAMDTGSASTENAGVMRDLRTIRRNHTFVYDTVGEEQFYRLGIDENASRVVLQPVPEARVVNETVELEAVRYEDLSSGERATVDHVLENSRDEIGGYRPRVDDPFVDQLPALVYKESTLYSLFVGSHTKDFGSGFSGFVLGIVVASVGGLLLLVGTGKYAAALLQEAERR